MLKIIDSNDIATSKCCFIRYPHDCYQALANITFIGNTGAERSGHAIYATSILPCLVMKNGCRDDKSSEMYTVLNALELVLGHRGVLLDDNPMLQP